MHAGIEGTVSFMSVWIFWYGTTEIFQGENSTCSIQICNTKSRLDVSLVR